MKELAKQPFHHFVGGFQFVRFLHDAARDIGITSHMCLACSEAGGGEEFQVGFRQLGVNWHRTEAGAQEGRNLLVLARGHRKVRLGEVHKGIGAVEESLQLCRELVPMHRSEDEHGIAIIDFGNQRREIILLDAVGCVLTLAGIAG